MSERKVTEINVYEGIVFTTVENRSAGEIYIFPKEDNLRYCFSGDTDPLASELERVLAILQDNDEIVFDFTGESRIKSSVQYRLLTFTKKLREHCESMNRNKNKVTVLINDNLEPDFAASPLKYFWVIENRDQR